MHPRLTIFTLGLLLLAISLTVQAVCIALLIKMQADASRAQEWALHTKEVIARVSETDRNLLEGYSTIGNMTFRDDRSVGAALRDSQERVRRQIGDLWRLVSDNAAQQARIQIVARQTNRFMDWLTSQEKLSRSGARKSAHARFNEGVLLLKKVHAPLDDVMREEERLDQQRTDALRSSLARQVWTTALGGAAILGTTLVLALLFLRNIARRLAVLRSNARSLAEGMSLREPLTGHDEIAEVDRAFHEMAHSLAQDKQENEMFVYSVSHDLRSPLINLQGFSQELLVSYREFQQIFQDAGLPAELRQRGIKLLNEDVGESIRYIQTAVGRLSRIIDGLLRLSRAGRVEYQWQAVDVEPLVVKVIEALHDTISAQKAEINVYELPQVWGDPTAVEQIFANLIQNAVLYLDPARSGRIEVGSEDHDQTTAGAGFRVYYVRDNGLGIPEAYHTRLFTAFSRLHAKVAQGEGVGLALVRRMVERHGGKIWLESSAGVGSTFFVALPVQAWDGVHRGTDEFRTLSEPR
jgi:signal transduction histidine kinase